MKYEVTLVWESDESADGTVFEYRDVKVDSDSKAIREAESYVQDCENHGAVLYGGNMFQGGREVYVW